MPEIRLWSGEKDGQHFPMPDDWDPLSPPLHCWVITAVGEWELMDNRRTPAQRIAELTTCAYKYFDTVYTGEAVAELHYERDATADKPVTDTDSYSSPETPR